MAKRIAMVKYEGTVAGAVDDAFSTLEELGGEMRERFDNATEALQQTSVNQTVSQTADELESLYAPDVPECVSEEPVVFEYKPNRRASRSDRRDEAVNLLESAKSAMEEWLNENEPADEEDKSVTEDERDELEAQRDEVESCISEIDDAISTAENCEFPGMYG